MPPSAAEPLFEMSATASVDGEAAASADATGDESAAIVPDVTAEEDDQARVGVPAFVYRSSDP